MKTALAILLLSSTSAFAADECYRGPKGSSVVVMDQNIHHYEGPSMIVRRGKQITNFQDMSGGTEQGRFLLDDDGYAHNYEFSGNKLIIDKVVYRLGC